MTVFPVIFLVLSMKTQRILLVNGILNVENLVLEDLDFLAEFKDLVVDEYFRIALLVLQGFGKHGLDRLLLEKD